MIAIRAAIAASLICLPFASLAETSGTEMRDEVIKVVTGNNWDAHTCRRVASLGEGKVSAEECQSKVGPANERCLALAKDKVPTVTNEEQTGFLVEILMTCPVADVLGVGYVVDGKKIHIQWSERDRPAR